MIAIIDYGMGNLRSVEKGFERVGAVATVTRDAEVIERAAGVVLPGVGAAARGPQRHGGDGRPTPSMTRQRRPPEGRTLGL